MRKKLNYLEGATVEVKFSDTPLDNITLEEFGICAYHFFDELITFYKNNPEKYYELMGRKK